MSAPMHCYRHPNRETYVSCSECGRPICAECMTPAPVGQRCPEHSGKPQGVRRVTVGARRTAFEGTGALVTKTLIGLNMYFLWFAGAPVEAALGRGRFLLVYLVSGLAGSAGALVLDPTTPTVGASGAIFGILGAALVMERQANYVLGGSALGLIVINLILSFVLNNISIGGHIGGLIGGILFTPVLSRVGRGPAAHIAVAYLKVRGYS